MLPSFVVVFWQTVEQKMSGKELNPVLMDIYKQGVSAHDRDIRNVIRYGTCKKAYNVDNKIKILKEDCKEVSEEKKVKNLKTEIQIMLELIEDSEVQLALTKLYNLNKSHGVPYLELFLESLTNNNHNCILSWEPTI